MLPMLATGFDAGSDSDCGSFHGYLCLVHPFSAFDRPGFLGLAAALDLVCALSRKLPKPRNVSSGY